MATADTIQVYQYIRNAVPIADNTTEIIPIVALPGQKLYVGTNSQDIVAFQLHGTLINESTGTNSRVSVSAFPAASVMIDFYTVPTGYALYGVIYVRCGIHDSESAAYSIAVSCSTPEDADLDISNYERVAIGNLAAGGGLIRLKDIVITYPQQLAIMSDTSVICRYYGVAYASSGLFSAINGALFGGGISNYKSLYQPTVGKSARITVELQNTDADNPYDYSVAIKNIATPSDSDAISGTNNSGTGDSGGVPA